MRHGHIKTKFSQLSNNLLLFHPLFCNEHAVIETHRHFIYFISHLIFNAKCHTLITRYVLNLASLCHLWYNICTTCSTTGSKDKNVSKR